MRNAGEILREKRLELGFDLDSVSKKLKIQPKYLSALEENNHEVFDSKAIAGGFLQKYANFLGLDTPTVLAFWRRDFRIFVKNTPPALNLSKQLYFSPAFFIALIAVIVVSVFIYLGLVQNSTYNSAPELEIFTPQDGEIVGTSNILLKGKVSANSEVWLNSRMLSLNSSGEFTENLFLHPGLNTLTFKALNPSNIEVTKSINIESKKQGLEKSGEGPNKLLISLTSLSASIFVEVKDSDQTVYRGFLIGPLQQEFRGQNLSVYLDLLEGTSIKYNDEEINLKGVIGDYYKDFTKQ